VNLARNEAENVTTAMLRTLRGVGSGELDGSEKVIRALMKRGLVVVEGDRARLTDAGRRVVAAGDERS
jgi:hypothetical protein